METIFTDHIRFDQDAWQLVLLDQRKLPTREEYMTCSTLNQAIFAIQSMVVRGAPAIGVTAAFAGALAAREARLQNEDDQQFRNTLLLLLDQLSHARPTAVNLAWAVGRLKRVLDAHPDQTPKQIEALFLAEAQGLQAEDVRICQAIGAYGGALLNDGDCVLTHCNAGALATAGYGTALGVIRGAIAQGKKISVIADETRPFLQGARLTCWELARDQIPVTLACDNACALLMQKGRVQSVVVGADRIAANGDTANKIGTFGCALLAKHFAIPFYVAAPLSTIDLSLADGSAIPIEERPAEEVTHVFGQQITLDKMPVYNFAFDVTEASLITAIITEVGVLRPPYTSSIAWAHTVFPKHS
ncbi:MAG: S-methyl-5-thioribose-1-phosphate isomerase [Desulfovibrio sp.]|nr:S-methyl-5-thioribose-1-phosphate isomerase [Desulfovibrio sp.]